MTLGKCWCELSLAEAVVQMGEGHDLPWKGKIPVLHPIQIGQKRTLPLDRGSPAPAGLFAERRSGTWGCPCIPCFSLQWV